MIIEIISYFIIFIISLIITTTLYVKYAHTFWKRNGIPYLEPTFPYGNTKALIKEELNFGKTIMNLYNEGKKVSNKYVGVYLLDDAILLPIDLDLIKLILTKDFPHFNSRGLYHNDEVDPLSGHLVNLFGPKWKKIRSKCTPMFTSSKIKTMFNTLVELSKELEKVLEEHIAKAEPIDVQDLMQKLMTDNIGSCAFGLNCNSFEDPNSEFRNKGQLFFDSTLSETHKLVLSRKFPFLFDYFRIPMILPEVTEFFMRIFKETVENRIQSCKTRNDFIDLFIKLKNNENISENDEKSEPNIENSIEDITFNELAAQAFAFFLAGLETSSSTLNFCAYELAANPVVQETLRLEIIDVLKANDGKLTSEALMQMKYLDQVVCEALRKCPPLPILNRICTKDYVTPDGNLKLKKGLEVWISSWGIQMDPEFYPNPDKFDPSRFTDEEKAKRSPFTFLPFGEGPRNCIGMRFGLLQVKVALVALLKKYKCTINPKTILPLTFKTRGVFLSLQNKVWLDLSKN